MKLGWQVISDQRFPEINFMKPGIKHDNETGSKYQSVTQFLLADV